MKLEDESLLSAYLDDELDPAGRAEVEAALQASPRLADRLHDLALARDLLSSLPRPTIPYDLAGRVLNRIDRRPSLGFGPFRLNKVGLVALGSGIAIAAGILVAATLAFRSNGLKVANRGPIVAMAPTPRIADHPQRDQPEGVTAAPAASSPALAASMGNGQPPAGAIVNPRGETERLAKSSLTGTTPAPPAEAPIRSRYGSLPDHRKNASLTLQPAKAEAKTSVGRTPPSDEAREMEWKSKENQPRLGKLDLPRGNLVRLTVAVDALDERTVETVWGLVAGGDAETIRMKVGQQVQIDPRNPEDAVVFALVIPEPARVRLREKLAEQFPDRVVEDRINAVGARTELAALGHFQIVQGPDLPSLGEPPANIPTNVALREMNEMAPSTRGAQADEAAKRKSALGASPTESPQSRKLQLNQDLDRYLAKGKADGILSNNFEDAAAAQSREHRENVFAYREAPADRERKLGYFALLDQLDRKDQASQDLIGRAPAGPPPAPSRTTGAGKPAGNEVVLVWLTRRNRGR